MSLLPNYRPKQLSLGPLESEILHIVWELGEVIGTPPCEVGACDDRPAAVSVKDVHDRILSDPERELAYTSVTTVLRRLTNKGWLSCYKQGRVFYWVPLVSREQAEVIKSYEQLHRFLSISNPEVVASFADSLDTASVEQLKAIASRIESVRRQREKK